MEKWTGDIAMASTNEQASCGAIAVFDLDADGTPEIIYGFEVFDNHGKLQVERAHADEHRLLVPGDYSCGSRRRRQARGDLRQQRVSPRRQLFTGRCPECVAPAAPQMANLDSDPLPEIFALSAREDGITVLENDGTVKFGPVNAILRATTFMRPFARTKPRRFTISMATASPISPRRAARTTEFSRSAH